MASERVERRLTAILAADVAGYSRLTGLDEEGTHVQLQDHLRTLVDPKIAEHRGRVVKNTGDGLLAEFSSVVDAVRWDAQTEAVTSERQRRLGAIVLERKPLREGATEAIRAASKRRSPRFYLRSRSRRCQDPAVQGNPLRDRKSVV